MLSGTALDTVYTTVLKTEKYLSWWGFNMMKAER